MTTKTETHFDHMEESENKKSSQYPRDIHGNLVRVGDIIKGFGFLEFQDNFKIDRTPKVTVEIRNDILYFGQLSASSFPTFEIVKRAVNRVIFITEDNLRIYDTMDHVVTVDMNIEVQNKIDELVEKFSQH